MSKRKVVELGGKRFTVGNLDKVLFPEHGLTKADLINYYLAVASVIIPHLRERPLVFTRYPDGIAEEWFYQKDMMPGAPDWVRSYPVWSEASDRTLQFCLCNDQATLAWIASQACIEIHPWMSRTVHDTRPDYAAFDLDPTHPAGFDDAREVAFNLRRLLEELGQDALLKTSGGTGLHVYVPIQPVHSYEQTREFVRGVAEIMVQRYPREITLERLVKNRHGVYIDYLQVYRGKTLVGAYSVRPRPGAPVSTPIHWEELAGVRPEQFTIQTVPDRIRRVGDPMVGLYGGRQPLPGIKEQGR